MLSSSTFFCHDVVLTDKSVLLGTNWSCSPSSKSQGAGHFLLGFSFLLVELVCEKRHISIDKARKETFKKSQKA